MNISQDFDDKVRIEGLKHLLWPSLTSEILDLTVEILESFRKI